MQRRDRRAPDRSADDTGVEGILGRTSGLRSHQPPPSVRSSVAPRSKRRCSDRSPTRSIWISRSAKRQTPAGALEAVAVAAGDDRLERQLRRRLEHHVARARGRRSRRRVDLDDRVQHEMLGAQRAVLVDATRRAVRAARPPRRRAPAPSCRAPRRRRPRTAPRRRRSRPRRCTRRSGRAGCGSRRRRRSWQSLCDGRVRR